MKKTTLLIVSILMSLGLNAQYLQSRLLEVSQENVTKFEAAVAEKTKAEALNGNTQAKEDYVRMFSDYIFAADKSAGTLEPGQTNRQNFDEVKAQLQNAHTTDQEFDIIKNYGFSIDNLLMLH